MNIRAFVFLALAPCLALASSLPTLKYRAMDSAGNPLSGAKLYFYTTGTTTPLATYSDEALSSANANPVVADSYGWFGLIYLKTDSTYRVVLKTSGDVTQWTLDGIKAAQLYDSSLETLVGQIATNPLSYGAAGDGATDDSTAVQAAISAATSTVDLLGKVYLCNSAITVPSGITIKNGTLDFSGCTATSAITLTGTISASNELTGNVAAGATTYAVTSASGLAAGDWQLMRDNQTYMTGIQPQELLQIKSISSLTITPNHPVNWAYTTANGAQTYDLEMVTGVVFDNVTFLHSATATSKSIVDLLYAADIVFKNCTFDGASLYGLSIRNSADITIDNCEFSDNKSTTGIGIYASNASRDIKITNSRFTEDSLYGIYLAGKPVRNILIENSTFAGPTYSIMLGKSSTDVKINKCNFFGDTAIYASSGGAANLSVTNSIFTNSQAVSGTDWWLPSGDWDFVFSNNSTIAETMTNAVYLAPTSSNAGDINLKVNNNNVELGDLYLSWHQGSGVANIIDVTNNVLIDGDITIHGDNNPTITSCNVSNNTTMNTTSSLSGKAVYVYGCGNTIVANNSIHGDEATTDYGLDIFSYGGDCIVSNNLIDKIAAGGRALKVYDCITTNISGNTVISYDSGIHIENVNYETVAVVSNNYVYAVDNLGLALLNTDASGSVATITGNNIRQNGVHAGDNAAYIYGVYTSLTVSGNQFYRANDTGHNLFLDGTSAGSITAVNITGNTFINGDYAIGEGTDANSTAIFAAGNYLNSVAALNEYDIIEGGNYPESRSTYLAFWAEADATAEVMLLEDVETETDAIAFTQIYDSGDIFDDASNQFDINGTGYFFTQYSLHLGMTFTAAGGDLIVESWIDLDGTTENCGYSKDTFSAASGTTFANFVGGCVFDSSATRTGILYVKGTWDDDDGMATDDCTISISSNTSYWSGHGLHLFDD